VIYRLARDESGVALGLAVVMVVLIGVMGAGLLTTVVTDLEAVVEANEGRQAFEMAEAGIEVAKARIASVPDPGGWSSGELRVGAGSVTVTVERREAGEPRFAAVSTGRYGGASRKIEAAFAVADGVPRLISWREVYA
jgi:hypothetical protein